MRPVVETETAAEAAGRIDLLDRARCLRADAFDLLEALAHSSTRSGAGSSRPDVTAAMQALVNVLGDIELSLSQPGPGPLVRTGQRFHRR